MCGSVSLYVQWLLAGLLTALSLIAASALALVLLCAYKEFVKGKK